MDGSLWRPLDPHRSWRVGANVAAGTTGVLGLALVADGEPPLVAWALIVASAVAAVVARIVEAPEFHTRPTGWALQYAWTTVGLAATTAYAVLLGGGPARYTFVFVIAIVASAGSYPRAGNALIQALTVTAVVVAWWLDPGDLGTRHLALLVGLLMTVMWLARVVSADLTDLLRKEAVDRDVAERRNRLLGVVGRAVTLDAEQALEVIVDAVVEQGFDRANVGVDRDGLRYSAASRGFDRPPPPAPVADGVSGRCRREERTIVVDDYRFHPDRLPDRGDIRGLVAVPIRGGDGLVGVLLGARTRPGVPTSDDVEVLELLAAHAGQALENAHRFRDEQEVVARLLELDTMKREFVSNVSHELRTPLTAVRGLAATLEAHGATLGPERVGQLVERVNANAERLAAMLDGLLDFSRPDLDERIRVRCSTVDLAAMARTAVRRLEPVLATHRVEVEASGRALAFVDGPLIEHVIENLLGNAVKHTPAGTAITLFVREEAGRVRLGVSDDGPGIPTEEIPRLTARFFRGERTRSEATGGSGLGLALVSQILAAHDTELEVVSSVGDGSTFQTLLAGATGGRSS